MEFYVDIEMSNKTDKPKEPPSTGMKKIEKSAHEIGARYRNWDDENSGHYFQKIRFYRGFLPHQSSK